MTDDLYTRGALFGRLPVPLVGPLAKRPPGAGLDARVLGPSKGGALGVKVAPAGNVISGARAEGRAAFALPDERPYERIKPRPLCASPGTGSYRLQLEARALAQVAAAFDLVGIPVQGPEIAEAVAADVDAERRARKAKARGEARASERAKRDGRKRERAARKGGR